jgi:hypothetical protein
MSKPLGAGLMAPSQVQSRGLKSERAKVHSHDAHDAVRRVGQRKVGHDMSDCGPRRPRRGKRRRSHCMQLCAAARRGAARCTASTCSRDSHRSTMAVSCVYKRAQARGAASRAPLAARGDMEPSATATQPAKHAERPRPAPARTATGRRRAGTVSVRLLRERGATAGPAVAGGGCSRRRRHGPAGRDAHGP